MTRWFAGWRPLLRIARRDALRARGRSALIVAMIALPILALTAADVLGRSAQLNTGEELTRELGTAQAQLRPVGAPVLQAPNPVSGWTNVPDLDEVTGGSTDGAPEGPAPQDLSTLVPAGYRVLTERVGEVETRTATGVARASWKETAVGDPAFAGRFDRLSGRAPTDGDEVAVSAALLDRLGVQVGDTVDLVVPEISLTVTGVFDQVGERQVETFWAVPSPTGAMRDGVEAFEGNSLAYLAGDRPVGWDDVLALNAKGVLVASRAVILDPPPDSAVPFRQEAGQSSSSGFSDYAFVIVLLVVVVVLAGLEVTLLAGAAFAVGARRQARSLGLLAAAGGSSGQVRRVVLSGGLVLGAVGAVAGVLIGILLAAVATTPLERFTGEEFGRFDLRPLELLAIAALGVLTGLLSAILPARTAARQDPVVALTGRRGQVRTARKVPVIGVVLTFVGVAAAAVGSALVVSINTGLNPANGTSTALVAGLIAGGAALAQIGLIITSPAIIGLVGQLGSRLPLPGRLAVRDAARHRGRSAPAMAAVLTAVTGSTALLLYITSTDAHDREAYQPTWAQGTGGVSLLEFRLDPETGKEEQTTLDPGTVRGLLAGELPPFSAAVVRATGERCVDAFCGYAGTVTPEPNRCLLDRLSRSPTADERERADRDWRCDSYESYVMSNLGGTAVGGPDTVRALGGDASPAVAEALAAGGVVTAFRSEVLDGMVTVDVVDDAEARAAGDEAREPVGRSVRLPGAWAEGLRGSIAVYSPAAAGKLGLEVQPSALVLSFDRLPTTGEEDAARGALQNAGIEPYSLTLERGYTSDYGLGLLALVIGAGVITLGASGVATGLAQADARADHATLAAVGAAPRLRRTLAAAQALTIALLGTALGIAAGFVPAVALIGAVESLDLVIPWVRLATVLLVVPLLAGVLAWLLTRSRVPLERRVG